MEQLKRILFVNSEITPYLPESTISTIGRYLPQGIQECGREIRAFMPRYGCINERRNQLHEVIRLSGMNIVLGGVDLPLVIKVASVANARMQVYFIDNEDFFQRRATFTDADGNYFADNGERAVFFVRGILETVKKLRWKPDLIHCIGWMSHPLPLYLKKLYHTDPLFEDTKVVLSLYNDNLSMEFNPELKNKIIGGNIKKKDVALLEKADGINLAKMAIQYADGIIEGEKALDPALAEAVAGRTVPVLPYVPAAVGDTAYINAYNEFYDKILATNAR